MRKRLTYSNVVATLALFIAVGLGGAYAAEKITSKDIAKSAVTSKAIKNKTVKGKDVKDRSITPADLAPGGPAIPAVLGNGVEADCLWLDGTADFPGAETVSYRRNVLGEIVLNGFAGAIDGPGGDAMCGGAGTEGLEDSQIFTIRPEDQPARTQVFSSPGGSGIILIAGVGGATFGPMDLAAGSVFASTADPAFFNTIRFLAADAPNSPAPAKGSDRLSPRTVRQLTR